MNLNSNGKQNMRSFINTTITMLMFFDKKNTNLVYKTITRNLYFVILAM